MPDIAMCKGDNCPLKRTCYRFTAKPSEYLQSYFLNVPYDEKEGTCNYQIPNKNGCKEKDDS